MINDSSRHIGTWVITVKDAKTQEVKKLETIKNRVMNIVLDKLASCFAGGVADLEIKYLALGTCADSIDDMQWELGAEIYRTGPSEAPATGATGEVVTGFTVLDSEAVANIQEIGVFGGQYATSDINSGTLVSRILWSHKKVAGEEITFQRTDKVGR